MVAQRQVTAAPGLNFQRLSRGCKNLCESRADPLEQKDVGDQHERHVAALVEPKQSNDFGDAVLAGSVRGSCLPDSMAERSEISEIIIHARACYEASRTNGVVLWASIAPDQPRRG